MSEKQLCNVHGSICLNGIPVEVDVLNQLTFLKSISQLLCAICADAVALQVQS